MTHSADVSHPLCHHIHCSLQFWKNGSLDRLHIGPAIFTIPRSSSHGNNLNNLIWLLLLLCVEKETKRDQSCAKNGITFKGTNEPLVSITWKGQKFILIEINTYSRLACAFITGPWESTLSEGSECLFQLFSKLLLNLLQANLCLQVCFPGKLPVLYFWIQHA